MIHFKTKFEIKSEHHLRRYFKFLLNYKDNKRVKYKTEAHHIYPKKYFKEFDNKQYIINLPTRAHYIAHYMLALAIGGPMWQSFQLMGRVKKHKSRHYAEFKTAANVYNNCPIKCAAISNSVKQLWTNESYRSNQINKKKEYVYTDEHRKNISDTLVGIKKPEGFGVGRIHSAKTIQKLSTAKIGLLNPSIKPKTIYDDNDVPIVTILTKFNEMCDELGFPRSLLFTYRDNNTLYDSIDTRECTINKLKNNGNYRFKGWYTRLAKMQA